MSPSLVAELLGDVLGDVDVEAGVRRVPSFRPRPGWSNLMPTLKAPSGAAGAAAAAAGAARGEAPVPAPQWRRRPPFVERFIWCFLLVVAGRGAACRSLSVGAVVGGESVGEDLAEEVLGARRDCGWVKNSSGVASSTIWPSAMKTTRLAALRAKPISWVTTIIVMPALARPIMTSRTSLIISGSSAEVGSSKSITLGSMASDAGDGDALLLAAGELGGVLVGLVRRRRPARAAPWRASRRRPCSTLRTLIGPSVTFSQDRLVREEVERLEDHADVGAQLGERLALLGQRLAVDGDGAATRWSRAG